MTKKERFAISVGIAKAFYHSRKDTGAQAGCNAARLEIGSSLKENNPKFNLEEFNSEVTAAIGLTLQHGDRPGKLTYIKTTKG